MISRDLELRDLDPEHWTNLHRLMHPPPGGDPQPMGWSPLARFARPAAAPTPSLALSPAMPALVLLKGGRVVRIVRWGGGTLPASELALHRGASAGREQGDLPAVTPEALRALRERHGLPFVAAVETEALAALWAEAQAAVNPNDDQVAQLLALARVLRGALGKSVHLDPPIGATLPLPSPALLQTTFNTVLPDDRSLVFYLTEGGRPWTSLIAVKRGGDVTLVTTHAAIADRVLFSDLRRDAPAVLRAVADRLAPPHLGVFLPLRVWHELVAGDRSAVARALAARTALLDPAPSWLLALVGAGAVAEAATRSARFAGKLLAGTRLGALLPGAEAASRLVQSAASPLEALGLDPWDLLLWARDWARRLELERERFRR